jgi:plasmid stability protein
MANLTLTIDEEVLKRARIRALEQGTSVNAVVREYLASYAGEHPGTGAVQTFVARARDADAGSGAGGRTWTREELHDRASVR